MICFPNAKINIGLQVKAKREDGFHEIETLMMPIPLFDVLEFTESREDNFFLFGLELGGDAKDNLVLQALSLMRRHCSIPPLKIHLLKSIPAGGGLGGGSADASFFLQSLNTFFSLDISAENLRLMAAELGSDCPFFIDNTTAIATGRGEILESHLLELKGYQLLLVFPDLSIATREAYANIHPGEPECPLKNLLTKPLEQWKHTVANDFEVPVFEKFPVLKNLKNHLYGQGAEYVSLTGSGATIYALFKKGFQSKLDVLGFASWRTIL